MTPHPPSKSNYLPKGNAPSPKIFNSHPQSSNVSLPPLPRTVNGCFCILHTCLLPTSTCSYFWSHYYWLNAVIIDFWRSWNNILKKHVLIIMLFYFFMCDDLSFINTTQKTFKPSEKMFECLGWMRKNFISGNFSWSIAAETWDASCFKKGVLEKQQSVPNTYTTLPLKTIFYQNLTDAFFKYL